MSDQDKSKILNIPQNEIDEILFQALRAIYQFERTKVAKFELTYEAVYLMQFLQRNAPTRMGDVAAEMKLPISTLTRIVDRLQKKGLVDREKDKTDRRSILLYLKPAGTKIVQDTEAHTFEILIKNLESYSNEQKESFIQAAVNLDILLNSSDKEPSI